MRIKNLVEAEVKPGQRKGMSLKVSKLEKMLKKIGDYQSSASAMHGVKVPDSVAAEYEKVKQGIYSEIEKLNAEKDSIKGEKNNLPIKFYNLMQGIAKNCTQIVQAYTELNPDFKPNKAKVFYRGIKSSEDALYGKPFDERRVMTSGSEISNIFNNAMKEAGFEARRDNSSFVSSDKNQASGYGKLYVMFPRDGFSFSWSRNTKDLILDRGSYSKMVDYEKLIPLKDYITANREKLSDIRYDFAFSNLFGDWDLDNTLKAAKRAIEDGKIPAEFEPLTDINNVMTPEAIVRGFELDQTDLTGAIESQQEVYVRGAYYAVQETLMKDIMKFLELQVYPEGKPKKTVPGQYDIGDRVTVKNKSNGYYGKSGEVQYVYETYGDVTVQLDGENWTNDFKIKDLKHEGADDGKDYNEGDKIEVVDEKSEFFGQKGTVSFTYSSGKLEVYFQGGKYGDVMPEQVKLTTDEVKNEPNDEPAAYEVTEPGLTPFDMGQFLTQTEYDQAVKNYGDDMFTVKKLNSDEPDVDSPDFNQVNLDWEPEPEVAAPASEKLKAGDKVKVTGFHYGGHTGTVDDVLKTGMVQVTLDTTGISKVFYANELAKVEPTSEPEAEGPAPDFKIGDTVTVAKGPDAGKTGKVDHVSAYFDEASIKLPDGTMLYDVPLEAIEKAAVPEQPAKSEVNIPDFKTGDSVKITKGSDAGKVGYIDYISAVLANADISTPHGGMINNVPLTDLQLLDFPVKNNVAASTPLKDLPAVKELIKSAAQTNQVTNYQLDQAMGTLNPSSAEIEDLLNYLNDIGMEVVDDGSF